MEKTVAAFDFDGTLTSHDTIFSFLKYAAGLQKALLFLFLESPFLLAFCLGLYSRQSVKERVIARFFKGMPYAELEALGNSFAKNGLECHMTKKGWELLERHRKNKDRLIVISASLEVYLKPFAEKLGVEMCLGTRLEVDKEGRITGKLLGQNCWGEEKVSRLLEYTGPKDYILYAYGNSRGDKELLEFADHPHFC